MREAVEAALELLDRGELRVAERTETGWVVHQWLKKAVLLSFRLNDMAVIDGRPGRVGLVGQGSVEVRGLGRGAVPRGRLSRRAGLRRPPIRLYRAGRGADAVLRQRWRLCRQRHHGRHLGVGQLLRADRQELPHFRRGRHRRRARAPAGGAGGDRGRLLHRRPRRGGRRRRSSSAARYCRWASISAPRPRSSTGPRARCSRAACRPIRWSSPAPCLASRCRTAAPGPGLYCAVIVKRVDAGTRAKVSLNELLRD